MSAGTSPQKIHISSLQQLKMKKKILIISTSLYGGGAEKALVTFLCNFDYKRYDIHLCLEYNWGISYEEIPHDVKLIYRYQNTEDWRSKIDYHLYRLFRFNIFESYRIKNAVDKQYDAIISFIEGKPLKFHRYVMNRTKNNITWVHADLRTNHYTIGKTLSSKAEAKTYKRMNKIVFVSENSKKQFEKLYETINPKKIVIYNPINKEGIIAQSKQQIIEKKKFTIVSIGRLSKEKGYDRLLRVTNKLNHKGQDFDLWIIGDGPMMQKLIQLKQSLTLRNVHFLGFKNPPYPWLAQADLFINSSYSEAAPLVLCEAMCLGIPVIATETAGAMELLENGKWGILTRQDETSLYEGILDLLKSQTKLDHYKKMATEHSKIFNIQNSIKQFYSLIE